VIYALLISFGSALAVLGMYDALFRLFFDKEDDINYQKKVCSTAYLFTQIMAIVVCILMVMFKSELSRFVFKSNEYEQLVIVAAIGAAVTATNSIISAPTRMQNKRKTYLVINTVLPLLVYSIAIPLTLNGYYVIALPIATIIADGAIVIIYLILNHRWFSVTRFDLSLLKSLLKLAIPLFPTFLIYWVFNSSDKLMIGNMMDVAQVGVYSAGAKLGHCSQIIYMAFAGGWSYFAFKTMNDDDQVQTRGLIFEYLGIIAFSCGICVFACAKVLCSFVYEGDYQLGYIVAPYLFLAPLMQMLFQVAANQFTIHKKTWLTTVTLMSGAIMNVILNFLLIPKFGIEGAAIASLLGYVFATIFALAILWKKRWIKLSKKFFAAIILLILYILIWRILLVDSFLLSILLAFTTIVCFFLLYFSDIKKLLFALKRK